MPCVKCRLFPSAFFLQRLPLTAAAIFLALFSISVFAQEPDPGIGNGVFPYQTYLEEHENINLGTGNLNLQIPLLKFPGRNGHDFTLSLSYNSQGWYVHSSVNPQTQQTTYAWAFSGGGWYWVPPTLSYTQGVAPNTIGPSQYTCNGNYHLTMWDGRVIYFPAVYNECFDNDAHQYAPAYDNLKGTSEGGPYPSTGGCAPDRAVLSVSDQAVPYVVNFPSGETWWFKQ